MWNIYVFTHLNMRNQFNFFEFKFGKNINFSELRLTKILSLLFDLIAFFCWHGVCSSLAKQPSFFAFKLEFAALVQSMASSVARGAGGGGGLEPPIGLWSTQNCTFLVLLRPIFGEKLNTAPPKEIGCQSSEVHVVIRPERAFEFPFSAEKSVSISVKTFFLETTCFWAEKTFEFPKNSVSIFGKTVWFWFKNNENSAQGRLHFSHFLKPPPPPPLFQILAMRLSMALLFITASSQS